MNINFKLKVVSFILTRLAKMVDNIYLQWRIQDFPQGGAQTPKNVIIFQFFAENCMKMKKFGPPGAGAGARP